MSDRRSLRTGRTVLACALFAAMSTLVSGCGSKQEFTEATGKVTIDGAPVTAGNVYFVSATDPNISGGGALGADGTFKAMVPVGTMKFAVQTRAFKPKGKNEPNPGAKASGPAGGGRGGPPAWASKGPKSPETSVPGSDVLSKTGGGAPGGASIGSVYVAIPEKYEDAASSGLGFEIKSGQNDLGEIKLIGGKK